MINEEKFRGDVCAAASEYIERGWSCFPISIDSKTPLSKWRRFQTELPTSDEIDDWSENGAPICDPETGLEKGRAKLFNLGFATGAVSGFVVVDCDNEQAAEFAKANGLSSPVCVKTRRGIHYYFRHPNNGRRFRNHTGNKAGPTWHSVPGLDFRGDGGYVVAPPSVSFFPDGTVKHKYEWLVAQGFDFDDMPIWRGPSDDEIDTMSTFDFSKLSLENASIGETFVDIRKEVEKRVAHLGRKLQGPDMGDSTDDWMIRFCGQCVRNGLHGQELWDAIVKFHSEYFTYHRSKVELERWLKTKMRSALDMDRRNHPQDYDPSTGERLSTKEVEANNVIEDQQDSFKPIYSSDFDRLLSSLGNVEYHADPVLPSRNIVQVIGYNGHGKSFFLGSMMTAIAAGRSNFGPFAINNRATVFYLDFDNPARTVLSRFSGFVDLHGDPQMNLPIWSPSIIPAESGGSMNLRTEEGIKTLEKWLSIVKPDIVVIDTIRNAFGGMDENKPQDWYLVNKLSKYIRDKYKATVVLVHHRNKPNDQGLGREAGSTSQLTDLDLQIIITQVYQDKMVAKEKAGIFDGDLMIERLGQVYTPFSYFKNKMSSNPQYATSRVRTVTQISFGKVREQTDLHRTTYIGWTEDINSGSQGMIWLPSVREDAVNMYAAKRSIPDIARELFVPQTEIKRWLGL